MLQRAADNLTIQASMQAVTTIWSDPIALGEHNLAQGVLVVHKLAAPASNTAELNVFPEYSNDGTYWSVDSPSVVTGAAGADSVALSNSFLPACAYARYRFEFDPSSTGTDNGIAYITFDWVVRYSNQ